MTPMNWFVIYPEAWLLAAACGVLLADLFVTDPQRRPTFWLTQASIGVFCAFHFSYFASGATAYGMQGMVVTDPMGHLLAFFAGVAMMASLAYARPTLASREMLKGEFYSLSLFVLLGISVMTSANNFLVVYLGLELMSLSLYALVALRRDHAITTEAAMKYFVLGALASGFLLYGLSMMYGATGSLEIPKVFEQIATGRINREVLVFGIVFVVAGLAFKLGAVPFHMWVPDVYQGAPTSITLLIAGAPKFAAFAITIRLLVEGMLGLAVDWQQMLIVMAVGSLVVGNAAAIAQTNLKRAGVLEHCADGLHPARAVGRCRQRQHAVGGQRLQLGDVLRRHLCADDGGHLRDDHVPVAPGLRERRDRRPLRPRQAQPLGGRGDDGVHVLAGRHPADGRLLRQAGDPAGAGVHQRHGIPLAGRHRRAAVAGRRVLLPARRQGHVLRRTDADRAGRLEHRRVRPAGRQRCGGAGVRPAARRLDGDLP
jgi:Proton-conducting membrane transporter